MDNILVSKRMLNQTTSLINNRIINRMGSLDPAGKVALEATRNRRSSQLEAGIVGQIQVLLVPVIINLDPVAGIKVNSNFYV